MLSYPNRVAFMTIVRKEVDRFLRIWAQTLLPPAITMSLYFIVFGQLIGRRIGTIGDYSYMAFVVPGLVMMSVINNAYSNVSSSFFSAKFQKHVEEILVAPVPDSLVMIGYVVAGVMRGLMVGLIVTGISLFFTSLQLHNIAVTLSVVVLTAILFSIGGFVNAMLARKFDDIAIVPTFVLVPMTYLGGVFYSVEMIPDPWQYLARANPILYMVEAFRHGMLGPEAASIDLPIAYLIILAFIVIFYGIGLALMKRGVGLRS